VTTYEKVLRGFDRVHLESGKTKTISFTIEPDDLALYNRQMERVVEPGEFEVMIGASSEDITLRGSFEVLE
jgi:beta-glucosidase